MFSIWSPRFELLPIQRTRGMKFMTPQEVETDITDKWAREVKYDFVENVQSSISRRSG
jgi:hypothetical protein